MKLNMLIVIKSNTISQCFGDKKITPFHKTLVIKNNTIA